MLGTRFGVAAVDLVAAGGFGKTVCLKGEHVQAVHIADAVGQMKAVDPGGEFVAAARAIGICFGDSPQTKVPGVSRNIAHELVSE